MLLVVSGAEIDLLCQAHYGFHQLVGDGVLDDHHGQRHAAFAGASAEGVDDALRGALDDRVAHHQRVVLGLGERLHALAMAGSGRVDVQADAGGADKGHALDAPDA